MKINVHFFIVLFIACVAFFNDIIIYCLGLSYFMSLMLVSIILGIISICFIVRKKIIIVNDYNKYDFIFWSIAIIFLFTFGIFEVDSIYDVSTYHIYLQENPFIDKVNFDFFPGRIFCCFLFPLGDRMYYIFRYLFGYRFGCILSYYIIIVLYYQFKSILNLFIKNKNRISIYSNIILCIIMILAFIGKYHIDNLGVIFLVEVFFNVFSNKNILTDKTKLYFLALYCGIAIGIKISNAFYILVFLLYILIQNKNNIKQLNILRLLICFFITIFPFAIYMIDNYNQTGSIVFPYYNSIFKSQYFGEFNWVDENFGIDNVKKIVWPIIVSFSKEKYGDDWNVRDPIYGIGYIWITIYCIYKLSTKRKFKNDTLLLNMITCYYLTTAVWVQFLFGYLRYGSIVPIISSAIICVCIERFLHKHKKIILNLINKLRGYIIIIFDNENWPKIAFVGMKLFCLIIICICAVQNIEKEELKFIFNDRVSDEYKIHIDGIWGTLGCFGTYPAVMVRENDTPIYNLDRSYFESSDVALKMYEENIKKENIYFMLEIDELKGYFLKRFFKNLEKYNFEIEEEIKNYTVEDIPYIKNDSEWVLLKLKYVGK